MSEEEIASKKERRELMMKRSERDAAEIREIVENRRWLLGGCCGDWEEEERDSQAPRRMKLPPANAIENNPIVV